MKRFVALGGGSMFVALAIACAGGGGSQASGLGSDGGPGPNAPGEEAGARRSGAVPNGDGGPICLPRAPSDTAPYYEVQINGASLNPAPVRVATSNGLVHVGTGTSPMEVGDLESRYFSVSFKPGVVADAGCQWFREDHSVSYDYNASDQGPVTGATSSLGDGGCSMTVARDGDGGVVEGSATGHLYNTVEKYKETFEFKACWRQPYP